MAWSLSRNPKPMVASFSPAPCIFSAKYLEVSTACSSQCRRLKPLPSGWISMRLWAKSFPSSVKSRYKASARLSTRRLHVFIGCARSQSSALEIQASIRMSFLHSLFWEHTDDPQNLSWEVSCKDKPHHTTLDVEPDGWVHRFAPCCELN